MTLPYWLLGLLVLFSGIGGTWCYCGVIRFLRRLTRKPRGLLRPPRELTAAEFEELKAEWEKKFGRREPP